MSVLLILFFSSLIGIAAMVGRKLVLLKKEPIIIEEKFLVQFPSLQEVRYVAAKNTKKYGYIILVTIIRFSIRSSKLLKHKYKGAKRMTKKIIRKYIVPKKEAKEKEVSGFLKMISEYKHKIRKIKDKVQEEEKENL